MITPGAIATEIASAMGRPNTDGYKKLSPVLQLGVAPGQAEDIAKTALFLASDDSAYISGDIIAVDGGWASF